jgi:hypothetical protein
MPAVAIASSISLNCGIIRLCPPTVVVAVAMPTEGLVVPLDFRPMISERGSQHKQGDPRSGLCGYDVLAAVFNIGFVSSHFFQYGIE